MGRNLYQGAAGYFPTAVDHPYGDVMNAARKMVFTRTLQTAGWANSTIIRGDLAEELELASSTAFSNGTIELEYRRRR